MTVLPITEVERMLSRSERDIRFVLGQAGYLTDSTAKLKTVSDGPLMILLVYDILTVMRFPERDILVILATFSVHLHAVGEKCGAQSKQNFVFQVADNRYASLTGLDSVYDIKEMAWLPRIRPPLVSLAIVLPELFRRAASTLEGPSGQLM